MQPRKMPWELFIWGLAGTDSVLLRNGHKEQSKTVEQTSMRPFAGGSAMGLVWSSC